MELKLKPWLIDIGISIIIAFVCWLVLAGNFGTIFPISVILMRILRRVKKLEKGLIT